MYTLALIGTRRGCERLTAWRRMAAGRPCGRAGAREERGPRAAGVRSLFVAAAGETTSVPGEKKLLRPDGPGGAELPGEEGEGQNVW